MGKEMILGLTGVAGSGKDTVADYLIQKFGYTRVALADPLKRIAQSVFNFSDEQLWGPSANRNEPDKRYLHREKRDICNPVLQTKSGVPEEHLTPRYALQMLGTWGRDCYPNVWIDLALQTAKDLLGREQKCERVSPPGYEGPTEYYMGKAYPQYSPKKGLHDYRTRGVFLTPCGIVISDVRFKNEMAAIHKAGGKVIRIVRLGAGLQGATAQHESETEQKEVPDSDFDYVLVNDGTLEALEDRVVYMMGELMNG
jgi:hypothetical protein